MESLKQKSLWEWMELLFIPAALLICGYFLNVSQATRQQEIENKRIEAQLKLENKRTETQLKLEEKRYISQAKFERNKFNIERLHNFQYLIIGLMANNGLGRANSSLATVEAATALTISTLTQLGGNEKGQLIIFLYSLNLIAKESPIISLEGADLSNISFTTHFMDSVNLSGINLKGSLLNSADFWRVNLSNSDLSHTYLVDSNFGKANVSLSNISHSNLNNARFTNANMAGVDLSNSSLVDNDMSYSNLSNAKILNCEIMDVDLHGTDIEHAEISFLPFGNPYYSVEKAIRDAAKSLYRAKNFENAAYKGELKLEMKKIIDEINSEVTNFRVID
ncbi:pentapeptide repeat-containing protein [Shewanella sp. UCD-KL12]|uniref:pentapeptide repeat-containing protein n=1 Tax=Shewanella sp. UCD-KL12 TaxID=1917163 RepID=UPI0009702C5E|nr:pentapeptide repeat-containing protein [Shewanella sp. UCD-KL12]